MICQVARPGDTGKQGPLVLLRQLCSLGVNEEHLSKLRNLGFVEQVLISFAAEFVRKMKRFSTNFVTIVVFRIDVVDEKFSEFREISRIY